MDQLYILPDAYPGGRRTGPAEADRQDCVRRGSVRRHRQPARQRQPGGGAFCCPCRRGHHGCGSTGTSRQQIGVTCRARTARTVCTRRPPMALGLTESADRRWTCSCSMRCSARGGTSGAPGRAVARGFVTATGIGIGAAGTAADATGMAPVSATGPAAQGRCRAHQLPRTCSVRAWIGPSNGLGAALERRGARVHHPLTLSRSISIDLTGICSHTTPARGSLKRTAPVEVSSGTMS